MIIEDISRDEFEVLNDNLTAFNAKQCGLAPEQVFDEIYKCVKVGGEIKGGISGCVELQCALHIQILWLDDSVRGQKVGTHLLVALEDEAKARGAEFAYLETFDFQAKDFYAKNGYAVFSELAYATGNRIYFMKKTL